MLDQLVQQNTKTRPRAYEDEKEKIGGPVGPLVHKSEIIK